MVKEHPEPLTVSSIFIVTSLQLSWILVGRKVAAGLDNSSQSMVTVSNKKNCGA